MKWSITSSAKHSGVFIIDDFLSSGECAVLLKYKQKYGSKRFFKKYGETHHYATANHDANRTIANINERVSRLLGLPVDHLESLVLLDYELNEKSDYHNDFEPNDTKEASPIVAQVLLYLTDVDSGGGTEFPNMGLQIDPKKGRAVSWYGVQGMAPPQDGEREAVIPRVLKANEYSLHSPAPVLKGTKIIGALFCHQNKYTPLKEVIISAGNKQYMVPPDQMTDIKVMTMKDVDIDKKKVTNEDKALKPDFDKITFRHHLPATPDLELKVVAMRSRCLIYADSRYPYAYRRTTNGKLVRLIKAIISSASQGARK